ncbi:MAG: amylo-alpha-1,6-glucosidase [Longimicrobiales bacterium]
MTLHDRNEWLEADGLGGFASGTASGVRTRRYHALLLAATTPPTGRVVLVNGIEAWIESTHGNRFLTTQYYSPDVRHPGDGNRIVSFAIEPWPTWRFRLDDGSEIVYEVLVRRGSPVTLLMWTHQPPASGQPPDVGTAARPGRLLVRPLLSGRDMHATHRENADFRFDADVDDVSVTWRPYYGLPAIASASNGTYRHDPAWYRNFVYTEERARGLDHLEDLASPGTFAFDLSRGPAFILFAANELPWTIEPTALPTRSQTPKRMQQRKDVRTVRALNEWVRRTRSFERMRRGRLADRLARAADAYLVRGRRGRSVIAGYPWFTDWGRDTFTALRGLCIATDRLADAREILLSWAGEVSDGMLPNRFVERGAPEYNSVDAALWYVLAADAYRTAVQCTRKSMRASEARLLDRAILAILEGYRAGTRHAIRMDEDGLLAAGEPGLQITWMDAKIGNRVITPRIGKPVEIQALWLNALAIGSKIDALWNEPLARGRSAFPKRFWNAERSCLYDVVDVDHVPGAVDATFRPNQIFAAGGLPLMPLDPARARRVVDAVEHRLLTPLGLRTLAPEEPGYHAQYKGNVAERDSAYHEGTVWPWLMGPFVEAWLKVRGNGNDARAEARRRFLDPLLAHVDDAGVGHVSEIADGNPPHTPRGCPFFAMSVAELIRIERMTRGA